MLEHERPIDGRDRYLTVYSIPNTSESTLPATCIPELGRQGSVYSRDLKLGGNISFLGEQIHASLCKKSIHLMY